MINSINSLGRFFIKLPIKFISNMSTNKSLDGFVTKKPATKRKIKDEDEDEVKSQKLGKVTIFKII